MPVSLFRKWKIHCKTLSAQNFPCISTSLLKDVDTSSPISCKANLGWEELLSIPVDSEHNILTVGSTRSV